MVCSMTIEGVSAVATWFTGSADRAKIGLQDSRQKSRVAAKAGVFMSSTT